MAHRETEDIQDFIRRKSAEERDFAGEALARKELAKGLAGRQTPDRPLVDRSHSVVSRRRPRGPALPPEEVQKLINP